MNNYNKSWLGGFPARKNDIYIFYEAIQQLEPEAILDIGMLMKRVGNVSRSAMNLSIAENTRIDGIDFFPELSLPVLDYIYDEIIDYREWLPAGHTQMYKLAVAFSTEAFADKASFPLILEKARAVSRYLLTDHPDIHSAYTSAGKGITELKAEEDIYYLIDFGVMRHGY